MNNVTSANLKDFYLKKFEVTLARWQVLLQNSPNIWQLLGPFGKNITFKVKTAAATFLDNLWKNWTHFCSQYLQVIPIKEIGAHIVSDYRYRCHKLISPIPSRKCFLQICGVQGKWTKRDFYLTLFVSHFFAQLLVNYNCKTFDRCYSGKRIFRLKTQFFDKFDYLTILELQLSTTTYIW